MKGGKFLLIDANSLIHRAYHALPNLMSSKGLHTGAIYGFVNLFLRIVKEQQPTHVAAAFDLKAPTFRHKMYAPYKATRRPMDSELAEQFEPLKELLALMKVGCVSMEGYEADDILGTLSRRLDGECIVLTGDRDSLQLVSEKTRVFRTVKGVTDIEIYDLEKLAEEGFTPAKFIDYKALRGDPSDNIPGVPGVGEKTAKQLLERYDSLDEVLAHADEIKGKLGENLRSGREIALLSRELATIDTDVPLTVTEEDLVFSGVYPAAVRARLAELELNSLVPRMKFDESEPAPAAREKKRIVLSSAEEIVDFKRLYKRYGFSGSSRFDAMIAAHLVRGSAPVKSAESVLGADGGAVELWAFARKAERELREAGLDRLYSEVELPLAPVLADMEKRGVAVSEPALAALKDKYEARLAELSREIYELAGTNFNIASPKQLGEVLFDKLGLPHGKKTKTGWSVGEEVLAGLVAAHPVVPAVLEWRHFSKLLGTYVVGMQPLVTGGRIHTEFNQCVTATGRLSSTGPNLQNIPVRGEEAKDVKSAFTASEGCVLVSADYSQIELRLLAHFSGDGILVDAFKSGRDIHAATAAAVLGKRIEDVTPEERRDAKAINFGIIYGMSDFGLAENLAIPRYKAKEFIDRYFESHPAVRSYLDGCVENAREKGYAETMMGRRRALPDIRSSNYHLRTAAERMAMNTPLQGTAAEIVKAAMLAVERSLRGMKAKMILQIHDELIVDAPLEERAAVEEILRREMEGAVKLRVPLVVETAAAGNWGDLK